MGDTLDVDHVFSQASVPIKSNTCGLLPRAASLAKAKSRFQTLPIDNALAHQLPIQQQLANERQIPPEQFPRHWLGLAPSSDVRESCAAPRL